MTEDVSSPTNKHSLALSVGVAALLLGIAGDWLLRSQGLGINWLLMSTLLIGVIQVVAWRNQIELVGEGYRLLLPLLMVAAAVAWRDSPTLVVLNVGAWFGLLALVVMRGLRGSLRHSGVMRYVFDSIATGFAAGIGALGLLFEGINWQTAKLPRMRYGSAVVRGLVLAVPLVLVFCGLFAAADAVFAQWVNRLTNFDFDASWLIDHTFMIAVLTWLAMGVLWVLFNANDWFFESASRPAFMRIGIIEASIVLGLLNLLFAAFVVIQIRYLFGGATLIHLNDTLTYAEYARQGFFELVTVAALVLPTLLFGHWLLQPQDQRTLRQFQWLAGGLLVLLVVIMASAVQRMRLYQQEYGLTELRFYTSVFMGWLMLVFGWFAFTVLRNRRSVFMFGACCLALVVVMGLNIVNPDALIVRTNAQRNTTQDFDGRYAASLSADAVPALIESLPLMDVNQRCSTAARLLRESQTDSDDWRMWNWSRYRAQVAVAENTAMLRELACPFDR